MNVAIIANKSHCTDARVRHRGRSIIKVQDKREKEGGGRERGWVGGWIALGWMV